jgi:hypothetical protein
VGSEVDVIVQVPMEPRLGCLRRHFILYEALLPEEQLSFCPSIFFNCTFLVTPSELQVLPTKLQEQQASSVPEIMIKQWIDKVREYELKAG